jgi:Uma2 family endonuclease
MGAKTLLTLEEFMALPDDGNKYELNEGELVIMPSAGTEHNLILNNITLIVSDYLRGKDLGRILAEASFALSREPELTIRQPDVSFVYRARLHQTKDYYDGAPELAVEVVSPSDHAAALDLKVRQYIAAGSQEVWVVYPNTRSVFVYLRDGQARRLSDQDTISSDLFPGWSARVADFFDLDLLNQ